MKRAFALLPLILLTFVLDLVAVEPELNQQLRLAIKLRDGSFLVGQTFDAKARLVSDAIGTVDLPLGRVTSIQFGTGGRPDLVTLINRDTMRGDLQWKNIQLSTSFGSFSLAKELVTELKISTGEGKSGKMEWEPAPFPIDSDWSGDRGSPVIVTEDGTIQFHGQPIYSKDTLALPVTIECDLVCPALNAGVSSVEFYILPVDVARDRNPVEGNTFRLLYRNQGRNWVLSAGRTPIREIEQPIPRLAAGTSYHMRLELTKDGSRFTVGDYQYEGAKPVLYDNFRIRIHAWPVDDLWQVKNFSIR